MNWNPLAWLNRREARIQDEIRSMLSNPPDWLIQWADGGTPAIAGSGVVVNEYTALNYSAVFQATRIIAEAVASLPLRILKQLSPAGNKPMVDDPRWDLLNLQPNEDMPAYTFRETLTGHAALWGNGYAEIERNGRGDAMAMQPIHPSRMKVKRVNGELLYEVSNTSGGTVTLTKSEVFHLRGLGGDGVVGYSVVRMARESMGLGIAAEQFGGRLFGNGARVGGWIKVKKQLSDRAKQNLRESLYRVHQGVENAHRFGILDEDMDFVQSSINPDDAQFLETRKFQITEVARWFNIQPHKLFDLERATFTNIEQQSIDFIVHTLRPWLVRWEAECKTKLIPERDLRAEHYVNGMMRGDAAARSTFNVQMRNIGALNVNEIRDTEGLNPIEGGEVYLVPLNMAPADKVENPDPPAPPRSKRATDDPQEPAGDNLKPVILDAAERINRRESESLKRAVGKPDFDAFANKFFEAHRDYVRSQLEPIAAMTGIDADLIARTHVADSMRDLRAGAAGVDDWHDRAADLATTIETKADEARAKLSIAGSRIQVDKDNRITAGPAHLLGKNLGESIDAKEIKPGNGVHLDRWQGGPQGGNIEKLGRTYATVSKDGKSFKVPKKWISHVVAGQTVHPVVHHQ